MRNSRCSLKNGVEQRISNITWKERKEEIVLALVLKKKKSFILQQLFITIIPTTLYYHCNLLMQLDFPDTIYYYNFFKDFRIS